MSKDLLEIVSLIKKMAKPGDPPVALPAVDDTAAPTAAVAPTTPSGGGRTGGPLKPNLRPLPTNNVGKMQTAMLNFANVAQSTDITSFEGKYDKDRRYGFGAPSGHGIGYDPEAKDIPNITPSTGPGTYQNPTSKDKPLTPAQQEAARIDFEDSRRKRSGEHLTEQKERSGGTNSAGGFLMKYYVKTQGHQYATVDMTEEQGRDTDGIGSIEAKDLRGLVATIRQLGTPGPIVPPKPGDRKPVGRGENVPDGVWDIRTNNSLKNIAALVGGVLKFTKDIGKTIQGYNQGFLNKFIQYIPKDPDTLSKEDKEAIAADYLQHINAMIKFYEDFKKQVLENTSYKKLMTQEDAFGVIKMDSEKVKQPEKIIDWIAKASGHKLVAQSENYYNAYKDKLIPKFYGIEAIYDNVPMRFSYAQLADVNAFKARIKEFLKREPTQNDINGVFDDIKRVIAANTAVETDELKTGKMQPQPNEFDPGQRPVIYDEHIRSGKPMPVIPGKESGGSSGTPNVGGNVSVKVNK